MTVAEYLEQAILVVDDEANIISALRRELNTPPLGRYRYVVEGYGDPRQALERAREKAFAVVVVDYRMPDMTGLDFLRALYAIQPDCARIVLSGQTDMAALVRMINETHIYRFIPKPWSSYFLKSSISQAIDFRRSAMRNRQMADVLRDKGIGLPVDAGEIEQILIVDDEASICHAVARDLTQRSRLDDVFAAMRTEVSHGHATMLESARICVQDCTSPMQALRMADATTFSCVIADYKMPEMDGTRFLEAFGDKQPDCARILLSGTANMDEIISAVDLAHIHSFIAKPWVDFEMRAAVAQALAWRRLQIENKVLASMCQARNLDYAAA